MPSPDKARDSRKEPKTMSKTVTKTVTTKSDLSGREATAERAFSLGGVAYVLDLTDQEAGAFDKVMSKYTAKASILDVDPATVREWAADNGFTLGARGRIAAEVTDAYIASLRGDTADETPSE